MSSAARRSFTATLTLKVEAMRYDGWPHLVSHSGRYPHEGSSFRGTEPFVTIGDPDICIVRYSDCRIVVVVYGGDLVVVKVDMLAEESVGSIHHHSSSSRSTHCCQRLDRKYKSCIRCDMIQNDEFSVSW